MANVSGGEKLWQEAWELIDSRNRLDNGEYHNLAVSKAVEISDFLSEYGEELDQTRPDIVTNLGRAVDILASGAQDTFPAIQRSPLFAGVDSFVKDDSSFRESILGTLGRWVKGGSDAVTKNIPTPPGGWTPWLIGGGVVITLGVAGYFWRSVKP